VRQARRFGLEFRILQWPWGEPWNLQDVERALRSDPPIDWIWGVHLESSTGVLNDLDGLKRLAREHGTTLCVDAVSSLGAVPLSLQGVDLASGVSGKSLGSYPGVAIVFAEASRLGAVQRDRIPEYLDLQAALSAEGPRFTFPSSPLLALDEALHQYATPDRRKARFSRYAELGRYVRSQLRNFGMAPMADEATAAPVITTFMAPAGKSSTEFVDLCRQWGYEIAGLSRYLQQRRLVQIATMGDVTLDDCERLFDCLAAWLRTRQETTE
ncbi:MAG: alanine--glyoxylate aminotransferase family protein, partial [Planctomycetes bacterium]|nr:alanine--glyoxylate aminotransferase family protein [Planctomycetota bacterium]